MVQPGATSHRRGHGRPPRTWSVDCNLQFSSLGDRVGVGDLDRSHVMGESMATRTVEPFLWLLFSAGGVLAALVLPAFVFLFGLAFPLGWLSPPSYEHLLALLRHPITRIML